MGGWDGIEIFIAVCETEGFSSAAARLGVSTSHVSRGIARLQVSMTDAVRAFLEHCL